LECPSEEGSICQGENGKGKEEKLGTEKVPGETAGTAGTGGGKRERGSWSCDGALQNANLPFQVRTGGGKVCTASARGGDGVVKVQMERKGKICSLLDV